MKLPKSVFIKIVKPSVDKVLISSYNVYRSACIKNNINNYMTFDEFCNFINDDLKQYNN